MFKRLKVGLSPVDRRFLSIKEGSKRTFSFLSSLILLVFSLILVINGSFSPLHRGTIQAFASQSYPPSGAAHYLYVFPDGYMYVYDMDNNYNLVYSTSIPTSTGVRGVVASPATGMLYVSYGGAGGSYGNGSLLKYDLVNNAVVWQQNYSFGIDSMGITPDGKTIYMPDGEFSGSNLWYVIDAGKGNVITSITAGTGPHNTIVSLNGQHVYMAGRYTPYLEVASTSTNMVTEQIGQLISGGRPFTINGTETYAFTTQSNYLGFQVSSITTAQVLYTVPINGFSSCSNVVPSHGITLSPDEKEVYVMDGCNSYVHVFDVSGLPGSAPKQVADIKLSKQIAGQSESGCAYDCGKEGWVLHSRDGLHVFVGDSGDIIDTSTHMIVNNLTTLSNTRKYLEIDWQNGAPSFSTSRYGLGYVTTPTPTPTSSATPTTTPTVSVTPTPTNTPMPGGVIAQDTFVRPNQRYWGTASDGNTWGGDANTNTVFSINNGTGRVANGNTAYNAVLGASATDSQVLFAGSMSSFSNSNLGAVLHWSNSNNWYKAYIDGTNLIVQKKVNGSIATLSKAAFTAVTNTSYSLRFQIVGTTLSAKVWATSTTEPSNWMVTTTDSTFASGNCGLRIQVQSGVTATYTSFTAFNLSTVTPTPTATPTVSVTPTPTNTPTPTPTPGTVITQDTFQRANQAHWGTASDEHIWGGDANTQSAFSITNNMGQVSNGSGIYNAVLGPTATNAEVLFTGSISSFSNANLGAVLRWTDANNLYKGYIDGSNLIIQKRVNGTSTIIASTPFAAIGGTSYTLRFRLVGTALSIKAWPTSGSEPGNWMATAADSTFSSGFCGLRIQIQSGIAADYTSFLATAQ